MMQVNRALSRVSARRMLGQTYAPHIVAAHTPAFTGTQQLRMFTGSPQTQEEKGMADKVKEQAEKLAEKAKEMVGKAKENMGSGGSTSGESSGNSTQQQQQQGQQGAEGKQEGQEQK